MNAKKLKDSVQDEQFSGNTSTETSEKLEPKDNLVTEVTDKVEKERVKKKPVKKKVDIKAKEVSVEDITIDKKDEKNKKTRTTKTKGKDASETKDKGTDTPVKESVELKKSKSSSKTSGAKKETKTVKKTKKVSAKKEKESVEEDASSVKVKAKTEKKEKASDGIKKKVAKDSKTKEKKDSKTKTKEKPAKEEVTLDDKKSKKKETSDDKEDKKEKVVASEKIDKEEEPEVDYTILSKEDLIEELSKLLESKSAHFAQKEVELIKVNFYKKLKIEVETKKKAFLKEGGNIEDFKLVQDPSELTLKELLKKYKNFKAAYNRDLEKEKENNLQEKYKVIEEIKDLVNRKESINETFQEFRELQKRWRNIGIVPQQKIKDLWETYHHHVEKFYDYIKINKELRDIDLKKNLEIKVQLCEKAEELLLEPSVVNAFKQLQRFHEQWREIGPVPNEMRTPIWERFKDATSKINKKHQQYFSELKKAEQKNLEDKTSLCDRVEEMCNLNITSLREWNKKSKEVVEIQKVWRTIGFAPKKHNNKIYTRFREACDSFFSKKRAFFAEHKQEEEKNLQLKTDLCIQAETLQDSTDWKKTTEDMIELQRQWKEIGPVPRKNSDEIWKRFRTACDKFFDNKSTHYSHIDTQYEDNLKFKHKLIKEIEKFELTDDLDNNFKVLKEFQKKWTEIGFVPFNKKDEIQNLYRNAINMKFDNLDLDDKKKNLLKFKNKLETIKQKPKSDFRIEREREKFLNKLKKIETNLVLWENNIGFFTSSKKADSMIDSFKAKIDQARKDMDIIKNKIQMIDDIMGD